MTDSVTAETNTSGLASKLIIVFGILCAALLMLVAVVVGVYGWNKHSDQERAADAQRVAESQARQHGKAYIDNLTAGLAAGPVKLKPAEGSGILGVSADTTGSTATLRFFASVIYNGRSSFMGNGAPATVCYRAQIFLDRKPITSELTEFPCAQLPLGVGPYYDITLSPLK